LRAPDLGEARDVLVHLEESPEGVSMNLLADRILYSKSGFTRVVDRMEEAGLIRRVRPEQDRRTILVVLTTQGSATLERARAYHSAPADPQLARSWKLAVLPAGRR
jgi:DNA-binding MarR family transcriptional regulator